MGSHPAEGPRRGRQFFRMDRVTSSTAEPYSTIQRRFSTASSPATGRIKIQAFSPLTSTIIRG